MYTSDHDQTRYRRIEIRFRVTAHSKADFVEIDEGIVRGDDIFVAGGEQDSANDLGAAVRNICRTAKPLTLFKKMSFATESSVDPMSRDPSSLEVFSSPF